MMMDGWARDNVYPRYRDYGGEWPEDETYHVDDDIQEDRIIQQHESFIQSLHHQSTSHS